MTKKQLLFLGIIIAGAVGIIYYTAQNYQATENESSAFVVHTLEKLAQGWNAENFKAMADPGLVKSMNAKDPGGVEKLFDVYRTLGGLKQPANCDLINSGVLMKAQDDYDVATYHCKAEYEAGSAKIYITVRKEKSKPDWQIYYMKIESDAFGHP